MSKYVGSIMCHSSCKTVCFLYTYACLFLCYVQPRAWRISGFLQKLHPDISVQLLEYDKRFEKYGSEFTYYDYNEPEELPSSLKHACQIVVADPPYLVRNIVSVIGNKWSYSLRLRNLCVCSHDCSYSLYLNVCKINRQMQLNVLRMHIYKLDYQYYC